jgi:hypothetical protein
MFAVTTQLKNIYSIEKRRIVGDLFVPPGKHPNHLQKRRREVKKIPSCQKLHNTEPQKNRISLQIQPLVYTSKQKGKVSSLRYATL